jgi:hypothetical protein
MGIRFNCPNGHKLNVKDFQAGRRGICPYCGAKFVIPTQSTRKSSKEERAALRALRTSVPVINPAVGFAGTVPAGPSQMFSANPSTSQTRTDPAQTGAEILSQSPFFSSPQDVAGSAFGLPVLPNPMDAMTSSMLKPESLQNASESSMQARPADPFIEAGDVVWYVRPPSGGQYGPATSKLMRQWLAEGRIGPNTLVWREGWRDWQQASEVFHQLRKNYPAANIAANNVQYSPPDYSITDQLITHQTPKNMLTLTTALIILTLIILLSLIFWAFTSKPTIPTDKPRTHSTRLELRDTLTLNRLS